MDRENPVRGREDVVHLRFGNILSLYFISSCRKGRELSCFGTNFRQLLLIS